MAMIVLRHVWINLVATGAEIHAKSSDRSYVTEADGDVLLYAGGRRRSISTEGETGQFDVTLRDVSAGQIATLREWAKQTVQLRDWRGKKLFGVYFTVEEEERKDRDLYDVRFELLEVTYVEGA